MTTKTSPPIHKPNPPAPEYRGTATYSPEDNKLRLYVGRIPRDEYLKLRAAGWVALHKQRETGGGDFAATWTPSRRDTALEYAGIIEDEDQGPAERAADRAERFSGYRDKRTADATGHADRFDAGPVAHGYQSQARAERAAARHDRIADRAGDAWEKAEYWQRRTAGVIAHALYKSAPGVRMGRIKALEAELRKQRSAIAERQNIWDGWKRIAAIADPVEQTKAALNFAGHCHQWGEYLHPRAATHPREYYRANPLSLYSLLSDESDPISGAEACALHLSDHSQPVAENDWTTHLTLRLAYENQMLAAAGGMLEQFEVLPGGKLGGKLIIKVSKSSVTKRATSCDVLGPKVTGWTYKAANIPGTEYAAYKFDLERIAPGNYTPPTPESLAELEKFNAERKAKAPKTDKAPLINPTDADAERLQALWNQRTKARHDARNTYTSESARAAHAAQFKPQTVLRITQATYSANSEGTYAKANTERIEAGGKQVSGYQNRQKLGNPVCLLRTTPGEMYMADRVIIITDKPQKPLPAAIWEEPAPATIETEAPPLEPSKRGGN